VATVAADSTIRSWNAAAERLYGWTAAEIVGTEFGHRIAPESRAHEPAEWMEAIRDGHVVERETSRVRRDGQIIWVRVRMLPVRNDEGASRGPSGSPATSPTTIGSPPEKASTRRPDGAGRRSRGLSPRISSSSPPSRSSPSTAAGSTTTSCCCGCAAATATWSYPAASYPRRSAPYLSRLTVTELKIDRAFVARVRDSDRRVVASTIAVAQSFGMRTVAEGIEDVETLRTLIEMGVELGQGFLLGRPALNLP
jgi:PAS domain S-box-containing protein